MNDAIQTIVIGTAKWEIFKEVRTGGAMYMLYLNDNPYIACGGHYDFETEAGACYAICSYYREV